MALEPKEKKSGFIKKEIKLSFFFIKMTNKENNQNNGNTSKASNKSKKGFRYYRNRNNNKSVSRSSNKQQAKKEYKFHMLDSQARKNS